MKRNRIWGILMLLTLVLGTAFTMSSCSKDDDSDGDDTSLSGTTWKIASTSDSDTSVGLVMTFQKDGNVTFSPEEDGWSYAKWTQNGNTLKIMLGDGQPDDYIQGTFSISGKTANYVYSWYDQYESYTPKERTYTMTLTKQ